MKNYLFQLSCILLSPFVWISCKDKNTKGPQTATNSSLCILDNYEYDGYWKRNGYMILDLNHDQNKDKKFMVFDIKYISGEYKFVVKRGPLPIDSLATNWPAEVKSVSYGYTSSMVVNAQMLMRVNSISSDGRFIYHYDSTYKFPNSILTYNYLNNAALYAGNMAGKTPQGKAMFWYVNGNVSKPKDVIFYFREGFCTNVTTPGNKPVPMTDLVDGIPTLSEAWKKIDAVLTIEGTYYTHFFFDFDEWRFFQTTDFCMSVWGAPCEGGQVQYVDYQSMNTLMDWPDGWTKP
ncbi:hypothetical protein [Xanthocytophaga flava]|uniref:hypothetical protein n=1 Tax=Xanthocytophaga flava TaxID=3048013 RepID=UPI0028D81C1C|nr:hypothetical protein [Xanthocytophaga flavus]MDJ1470794.1 hypothetical protein [Xanthocytophaga flavus]